MTVPYAFGAATSAIPLSQLDSNFNTPITLGNTAIQLGNTVTTLNNMTLANVTVSSGNVTITNVTVTTANATTVNTTTLIATTANVTTGNVTNLISGNVSLTGGTITGTPISGSTGSFTTLTTSSTVTLNGGTAGGVAYLDGSKVLTSGSALTFDGTTLANINSDGTGFSTQSAASNFSILRLGTDSVNGYAFFQSGKSGTGTTLPFAWRQDSSELMRLTSTGLGIGTSSPGFKLDARLSGTSSGAVIQVGNTGSGGFGGLGVSDGGAYPVQMWGAALSFLTGSSIYGSATEKMRLDSSGNLGLGVTPSAWRTQNKTLQIGATGVFTAGTSATSLLGVGSNWYLNSGSQLLYIASDFASNYEQASGQHRWFTAPSGTAGNAISFTQAMTLDASGNLGVGTTSPSAPLHVSGSGSLEVARFATTTDNTPSIGIYSNGSIRAKLRASSAETALLSQGALPLLLGTNDTERARITSGGDVGIGTTSPAAKLTVQNDSVALDIAVVGPSSSQAGIRFGYSGATFQGRVLYDNASNYMAFTTNGSERARITSGGEVYIAGTTDQGAYNLQVNGTGVWGAGAYVNGSDRNLKNNIQSLDSCLDVVMAMRPVTFQYKPEHSKDQSVQPGFIAQELQEAMAGKAYIDGVVQSGPEYLNVAYQNIIPILVKAIQELKAEFDAYKATHP